MSNTYQLDESNRSDVVDINDLLSPIFPWHQLSTTPNSQRARSIKAQILGIEDAINTMQKRNKSESEDAINTMQKRNKSESEDARSVRMRNDVSEKRSSNRRSKRLSFERRDDWNIRRCWTRRSRNSRLSVCDERRTSRNDRPRFHQLQHKV